MDSDRGKKGVKKMEQRYHLKMLAHVRDFTIFYGKEHVKEFLLLMSIFLQTLEVKEPRASDFLSWGTWSQSSG
jgi:hypothetical protein